MTADARDAAALGAEVGAEPADGAVPRRRRRRAVRAVALLIAVALGWLVVVPVVVLLATAGHRHADADGAPTAPVVIVLGAGIDAQGNPSPFLAERLDVAIDLYRRGAVRALLMSGDNSRAGYDEVGSMATYAIARGVPASAVVTDHAGFDTYSSCYRARSVWGVDRAIVVTQAFHLPRAVFLCRRLGVDVDGVVASDQGFTDVSRAGWVRELPAVHKAALDLLTRRTPTFPGPREHTLDGVTGSR